MIVASGTVAAVDAADPASASVANAGAVPSREGGEDPELERTLRIARNRRVLAEMGLAEASE